MKIHQRARFLIFAFFGLFLTKKGRNWKKWRKLAKSKPFDEIFWNLVCRCILVNENSPQSPIFDFCLFWPVLTKKGRNWQKWRKLAKSKPFNEIFWNLVCRCFPTKKMLQKNFFWISAFFGRFLTKKQPKLTKNEKNWQNSNRLMKFSEIWYVDAS